MPYTLTHTYTTDSEARECLPVIWAEVSGIGEKPSLAVFLQALWVAYGFAQSKGFPVDPNAPQTANPRGLLKEHMRPYFAAEKPHAVANINWGVWGPLLLKILQGVISQLPVPTLPPAPPATPAVDASGLPELVPPLPEPNAFPPVE